MEMPTKIATLGWRVSLRGQTVAMIAGQTSKDPAFITKPGLVTISGFQGLCFT